ncbi:hypothetical protein ABIB07_001841 [Bradyrhizobium sp. RT10b]
MSPLELEGLPKITLAGKDFPIALLAPRQNRIVIPKLIALMQGFTDGHKADVLNPMNLTTQQYDDLCDVVWVAVTRATPTLTKEAFLDMPIDLLELIAAMDVVAKQCGVMKRAGDVKPGEAPAMVNHSTGTASSPV